MIRFRKKDLSLVLFAPLFLIALAIFVHLKVLMSRFPDMDLTRMRFGVVSWYSETDENINEHTASGEVFDDEALTCASWDFSFGEKLLVINVFNGKSVVCRVNDRGPAKYLRREVDLTKTAFSKIANPRRGLIHAFAIPTNKKKTKDK